MAENRFKKSVDAATSNTLDNTLDNILDSTSENILYNIKDNILKNITEKEHKSRGGNHTFYLSAEVGEGLNRLAKKTKKSKSTLVNDILRAVLINEALN
jgi:predicted DNA-binding protein